MAFSGTGLAGTTSELVNTGSLGFDRGNVTNCLVTTTFCANDADGEPTEPTTFGAIGVAMTVDDDDGDDATGLFVDDIVVVEVAPLLTILTGFVDVAGTSVARMVGAVEAADLVVDGVDAAELEGT